MQKKLLQEADHYVQINSQRRIWRKIVRVMACIVVFCTTYSLILPALTMEKTSCGLEEHTHTLDCYEKAVSEPAAVLSCTYESLGVHVHASACYDSEGNLQCGQADFVVHEHNAACVDENGSLVCKLPVVKEHEHDEACYQTVETQPAETEAKAEEIHVHGDACYDAQRGECICQLAETEGHSHGPSCFTQGELICRLTEQEGHTHTEGCSETVLICELEREPHEHTDSCYQQLVCELPEDENHTHSEECSGTVLCCDLTEQPHVHSDGCYEIRSLCQLPESEGHTHGSKCYESILTCELSEEAGHSHTDSCYEMVSVLVCELEEGVPETTETEVEPGEPELICGKTVIKLHSHDDAACFESYVDANGEERKRLICTELAVQRHVHGESCFTTTDAEEDALTCTLPENENHTHSELCYGTWVLVCGMEEHTHDDACTPCETTEALEEAETLEIEKVSAGEEIAPYSIALENVIGSGSEPNREGVKNAIHWKVTEDEFGNRTITFSGTGGMKDYASWDSAPWSEFRFNKGDRKIMNAVVVEAGITYIARYTLNHFQMNKLVIGPDVEVIDDYAATNNYDMSDWTLVIPGNVKRIGSYAFYHNGSVGPLVLEEGVEEIGSCAFNMVSSKVFLPNSLKSIQPNSFIGSVEEYVVSDDHPYFTVIDGVLYDKNVTTLIAYPRYKLAEEYVVPSTVTTILQGALSNVARTSKLYIPATVKNLETDKAFSNSSYQEIVIEDGVGFSGNGTSMFSGCAYLRNVELPENTNLALNNGFGGCTSLETITIPVGSTSLSTLQGYPITVNYKAKNSRLYLNRDYVFDTPGFELKIGDTVDKLQSSFYKISAHAGKILFVGPNTLVMEEGSFTGADAPLEGLVGDYYVDTQGVLYAYDKNVGQATVVYCPYDVTEVTIPAVITPDDGIAYPVTGVGRNALALAEKLTTLKFEDLSGIKSLETLALANCPSLTEVNGETTVEGATALFTDAVIGYNAFYNSGLTGAPGSGAFDQEMDGENDMLVEDEGAAQLNITPSGNLTWADNGDGTGGYRTLTGETITLSASAGDTVEGQTKVYRVYFRITGEDAALSIVPGKQEVANGWVFSHHATEDPYTYYIQFGAPPEGNTAGIPVNCTYPNIISRGGGLTVWGVVVDPEEPQGTILPSDNTVQISWTTQADSFAVTKTPKSTNALGILGDGEGGARPSENIEWTIQFFRETEITSPNGKDHATGVEFWDVFTLPEGINWREDVAQALANGTIRASGNDLYAGETKVATILGKSLPSNSYMRARKMTMEDGKAVLSWGVSNSKADAEMGAATISVTIYADALRIDNREGVFDPDTVSALTNEVYATVHYTYRKDAVYQNAETGEVENPQLYSAATRNISGGKANFKLSHTVTPTKNYFGEEVQYTIDVYNDGALTWYGETTNGSTVYTLKEVMPDELYLSLENMQKMFEERPELVITISNATLSTQWGTTVGVDGQTEVLLHQGNSDSIVSSAADQTITISVTEGIYTVAVAGGESHTGTDLAVLLERIGYVVTDTDLYTCAWPLNEEGEKLALKGGKHNYFYVYPTVKDTFQIIKNDWEIQYQKGSQTSIQSRASVYTPANKEQIGARATFSSIREIRIEKDVTCDGEALPGSYAATDGAVLDWKLTLSHYGSYVNQNLPLVDDIYGSQYLLVPQEGNESLAGLPTHEEFYILAEGNYTNVWVGVDDEGNRLMAASVEVRAADENSFVVIDGETRTFSGIHSQIKWYFPEIEDGTYMMTVKYQTLVDHELTGLSYTIGNLVRLNDREAHHLYDVIWGGGTLLSFDKDIVVTKGGTPNSDTLDADDYTSIGAGEAVTYRMEINSNLDTSISLNGLRIADGLPLNSIEEYPWEKDVNILDFRVVATEGVSHENLDQWYVGDEYGGLVGTRQYILWPESANITFNGPGTIYLYFTLVYPENSDEGELWDLYVDLANGGKVYNDFFVYRENSGVEHDLKESGRVLLQKGVYGTYHYTTVGDTYQKPSNSRLYFNNRDSRKRTVAYYVLLYNDTNKRLYLNDLYDQLPEGFTFLRFIDGTSLNSNNTTSVLVKGGTGYLSTMTAEKVSYRSARITADTTDGLKFSISAGTGENALHYDPEFKQYYLEKGEAIEFGYLCDIDEVEKTHDSATNMIAMPYTDHIGTGVTVVSKEKIHVTAAGQEEYFSDANDGRRLLKNDRQMQQDYGIQGGEIWLVSDVTLYRGSIVPGVTKYVDSYRQPQTTQATPYVNQVFHDSIVNWRVRLHNSGTLAMSKYTFTDVLQYPYSFVGDVTCTRYGFDSYAENAVTLMSFMERETYPYVPQNGDIWEVRDCVASRNRTVEIGGEEVAFGNGNNSFYVSVRMDKRNNLVLSIRFESVSMAIMEGGYMDITLSSVNETGNYAYSVYTNQAILTPKQDFSIVGQGSVVKNESGKKTGAKNSAAVTVSNGIATTSTKQVAETAYPENKASDGSYIVLSDADSLFTYTLSVYNDTKHDMNKLVLLDNLPEANDHNPFDTNTERNSEFLVALADDPDFSVLIVTKDGESYAPSSYQIQYSTGTDFGGPQSVHWTGGTPGLDDPTVWTDHASGARSIRVIIDTLIPDEAEVVVRFNAKVSGDANPGATAYNSFGYHYELQGQTYKLEAMSPVVGVRIPDIPSLSKRLVDSNGTAIPALEDREFRFLVYEGSAVDETYDTTQSLLDALVSAGRAYQEFLVSVKAGESISNAIELTAEEWIWQAGATYTITELPTDEMYSFRRYVNTAATSYTFIHTPELSPEILCENMLNLWTVRVRKENPEGERLAGAVFALYSPDPADQMTDIIADAEPQILHDGQTLYLAKAATSDEEGMIEWTDLLRGYYYLLEIKAPDGYNLPDPNGQIVDRSSSVQNLLEIPVVNTAGYELPETGGAGTDHITRLALLMVTTGMILMHAQQRKRKK